MTDPDIPDGYSSYGKGEEAEAQIRVLEIFQYEVVLKMNIISAGSRKLTKLYACYSETNPSPDLTDYVQDIYSQYESGQRELLLSLSDLEPVTNYYCRLYLGDLEGGVYTNSVVFSTKVPSNDSSWELVASIPCLEERYTCGFNFDDRFFALSEGGNKMVEYLPKTDEWVDRATLPFASRLVPVAVVAGGKGYAGLGERVVETEDGGRQSIFQRDWWCYDPKTDEWERKADIPSSTRGWMTAFGVGEKIYAMVSADYWISTPMLVWEYDTRLNTWTRKGDFPGDKLQHTASFVIDGRPFVFTGMTNRVDDVGSQEPSRSEYTTYMWEYEVDTDTWYRRSDFKGDGREWMVATALNGKGYAGFGFVPVGENYISLIVDWWKYDPKQDLWKRKNVSNKWLQMLPPLMAFSLKGNVYIVEQNGGVWKYVEE